MRSCDEIISVWSVVFKINNVASCCDCSEHIEIFLIELQSLVVFNCAALLFMVGATARTHDREEGWDDFLFVYTE